MDGWCFLPPPPPFLFRGKKPSRGEEGSEGMREKENAIGLGKIFLNMGHERLEFVCALTAYAWH